jgi:hypothetical protein
MLDPVPGEERLELHFWIEDYDGVTEATYPRWSGRDTPFIQKMYRPRVLASIANLTQHLVEWVKPPSIMMISNDADVRKSLAKHNLIANVCQSLGYNIRSFEQYHGRWIWCMDLQSVTLLNQVPTTSKGSAPWNATGKSSWRKPPASVQASARRYGLRIRAFLRPPATITPPSFT